MQVTGMGVHGCGLWVAILNLQYPWLDPCLPVVLLCVLMHHCLIWKSRHRLIMPSTFCVYTVCFNVSHITFLCFTDLCSSDFIFWYVPLLPSPHLCSRLTFWVHNHTSMFRGKSCYFLTVDWPLQFNFNFWYVPLPPSPMMMMTRGMGQGRQWRQWHLPPPPPPPPPGMDHSDDDKAMAIDEDKDDVTPVASATAAWQWQRQ